jgi:hypothetical protein
VSDNATVYEWFGRWMRYHQRLYQHLKGWVDPGDDEYYLGWVEALARAGATEDLAMHASRLLQARKAFRSDHLAMLVEIVGDLRRKAAEAGATRLPVYTAEQLDAMQASAACPECDGTGWARRRAAWHSIPRPFVVDLYCRCPHGRWRRLGADGNHDDLQGRPELWDPALDSPTWSAEATAPTVPDDREGRWRYLGLDESAPAPAAPLALAGKVAGGMRRVARAAAVPVERARQWAASPDPILAAEGARALAEAGVAEETPRTPAAGPPASGTTPGPSGRPRGVAPWLGPSSAMASGDDEF